MKIALIAKPGHADSGVGRYVDRLAPAIEAAGHEVVIVYPIVPLPAWFTIAIYKILHWDLKSFFLTYPIWISYPNADVYHFTSQNLATLMILRPPRGRTVITVHDIIPWQVRKDPELNLYRNWIYELFDRLALWGIKRCHKIISDSDYTAHLLSTTISRQGADIQTIHLAVE